MSVMTSFVLRGQWSRYIAYNERLFECGYNLGIQRICTVDDVSAEKSHGTEIFTSEKVCQQTFLGAQTWEKKWIVDFETEVYIENGVNFKTFTKMLVFGHEESVRLKQIWFLMKQKQICGYVDLSTSRLKMLPEEERLSVNAYCVFDDQLVVGSHRGDMTIFTLDEGKNNRLNIRVSLKAHHKAIRQFKVLGKRLFSASLYAIKIWDICKEAPSCLKTIRMNNFYCFNVVGLRLFISRQDKVDVHNWERGSKVATLESKQEPCHPSEASFIFVGSNLIRHAEVGLEVFDV
jgi:hypothetical protein